MKKAILIIFSMCLLFPVMSVNAAPLSSVYTISGDCVYDVPLYTTANEFLQNIESDEELSVVVKSVSNDSYSNIGRNSFVTEQCLLKSGENLYSIDTITPFAKKLLQSGESKNISSEFTYNSPYIMLSFSMQGTDSFSQTELALINGKSTELFSFEKGADGFCAIKSGNKKQHLLRYSAGESILAEIFLSKTREKIAIERIYINGEECNAAFSFDTRWEGYALLCKSGAVNNLCISNSGSITSLYKGNYLNTIGEDVKVFENFGTDNIDSVFLTDTAENADTPFGTEIVQGSDSLLVNDLFSQTQPREYNLLSQIPTLGKIRLFKDSQEIFALTDGAITLKRTVPEDYVTVTALYSEEGKIKNVSFEKTAVFECKKSDSIKVFVLSSKESIVPVTVAAHITKDGIFNNDGFVVKGE